MTNPVWAGVTIDPELLKNYGWYTDTVVVDGTTYTRLIGYQQAGLTEMATLLATGEAVAAAAGGAVPSIRYAWDAGTTDADPGAGEIRGNNGTLASITQFFMSTSDANSNDVSTLIGTFDDSTSVIRGFMGLAHREDTTKWAIFSVSGSVVSATGYRKLTAAYISGPGGFSASDPVAVGFIRTGDSGTNGATWSSGSGVPSGGADGDFYLRTTNGDVYQRATGSWSVIANLTGPTGLTGDNKIFWGGTAGGTANALTVTTGLSLSALARGHAVVFRTGASANTSAATIAVDTATAAAIQKNGSALVAGDLPASTTMLGVVDSSGNVQLVGGAGGGSPIVSTSAKSADFNIGASDTGALFYCTGSITGTLAAASTLANGWRGSVVNSGAGIVTITGSDTINGSAGGIRLSPGDGVLLHCDGTRIFAIGQKAAGISGYILGGTNGGYLSSIEKYNILANTMVSQSATLAVARQECAGVNSDVNGYAIGGYTGSNSTEIDGIKFSNDAAINPSAVLTTSQAARGGVNSATRGYIMGGYTASNNPTTEIQGFTFATETATDPAAVLSAGRARPGYVNSATKGYACAGESSSTVVDGITFSTDTAFTGANAISARDASTGVNSAVAGYLMSGNILTNTAKLVFSNDATSTISDTLATNRASAIGFNDDAGGYAWGNASSVASGSRLDFTTETSAAVSVSLTTGRQAGAGVQSGGIL